MQVKTMYDEVGWILESVESQKKRQDDNDGRQVMCPSVCGHSLCSFRLVSPVVNISMDGTLWLE